MKRSDRARASVVNRRQFMETATGLGVVLAVPWVSTEKALAPNLPILVDPRFTAPVINPSAIPKFTDPLPVPGKQWPVLTGTSHKISLKLVQSQVLPQNAAGFPKLQTACWGYRTAADYSHTYLGPTIVGLSGKQTKVRFDYSAIDPAQHLLKTGDRAVAGAATVVDSHVHGTHVGEPGVRFVAHKHGNIAVDEKSDGYSESWVTPDGKTAATFNPRMPMPSPVDFEPDSDVANAQIVHNYPNAQGACLAWYHDHGLGITRLNVYAGMAAGFIVTDDVEAAYIVQHILPTLGGPFDVPLVIQDRMFYGDGSLAYPDRPTGSPADKRCAAWPGGPSTLPEYFGDCMVVNGKTWPFLDVEPTKYRLRFLNGCNARFLDLSTEPLQPGNFTVIGTEGGFLPSALSKSNLLLAPAERFDVILDFAAFAGKTVTLTNKGTKKPFPGGTAPKPGVDDVVMQFRVKPSLTVSPEITAPLPPKLSQLPAPLEKLGQANVTRRVLLFEGVDEFGRVQPSLGQVMGTPATVLSALPLTWNDPVTETPKAGAVEIWEIYNTTTDAHPIHVHEILFSVLGRQPIGFDKNEVESGCSKPAKAFSIHVEGTSRSSEPYEKGFKDTVIAYPSEVTRIVLDFTAAKPGRFAWHCHILEHEDHEMMRPYDVIAS